MGVCCDNVSKKITIKLKRKKKKKTKDKLEEMNFEIVDVNEGKSHQILTKTNKTLRELLTQADFNLTEDFDVQLKNNKNINEEFNTNLRDIIEKYYPDSTLITLTLLVNNKGLYIPSNVKKAYEEMTPIIGSAIFDDINKLGISIYYRDKQVLETFYLDKAKLENIQRFNSFSAYCSARGVFYISGGEGEEQSVGGNRVGDQEAYGNFIGIDMTKLESYLNNEEISKNEEDTPVKKLPSLNIERSWHSMIFIPNKYIFIIGGIYTQIVERYDIDKNEIKLDSELKQKRCEPALCLVNNNYLYAFCGFNAYNDFNNNIERCNLLKKKREWEIIGLSSNITGSFFGISIFKDNEILLISSKDNVDEDNKNYMVKIGNDDDNPDEIKETVLQFNGVRTFKDKLFYPMYDNYCVNIPMNVGNNKSVLILDINTGNIECKNYK